MPHSFVNRHIRSLTTHVEPRSHKPFASDNDWWPGGQEQKPVDDAVIPGSGTDAIFAPGGIHNTAVFSQTLRPPVVVDTLPALPDEDWPPGGGHLVFLTSDQRLYKNDEDGTSPGVEGWIPAVSGADLPNGSITGTKITDGAIETPHMTANTISGDRISAGTLDADKIIANSITAGQIEAGAIGATEIAAGAITTEKIAIGNWKQIDFGNLLLNASFEALAATGMTAGVYSSTARFPSWSKIGVDPWEIAASESANVKHGRYVCALRGLSQYGGITQYVPVKVGKTYKMSGWVWKGASGGTGSAQIVAHSCLPDYSTGTSPAAYNVMACDATYGSSPLYSESKEWVCPEGVSWVRIDLRNSGSATSGEAFAFDDIQLVEVVSGVKNKSGEVYIDQDGITVLNGKFQLITGDGVELGLRRSDNLVPDPSFELGNHLGTYGYLPKGWTGGVPALVRETTSGYARTGTRVLQIKGDGASAYPSAFVDLPCTPGKTYRVWGWVTAGGGTTAHLRMDTIALDGGTITAGAGGSLSTTSSTPSFRDTTYTVPDTGVASTQPVKIRVFCFIATTPSSSQYGIWEDVGLEEVGADVRNATSEVVIDKTGITVTNGKVTIRNPSSTVIIDGTSDMFRIAATGTATFPTPAYYSYAESYVTVSTGFTYRPMIMAHTLSTRAVPLPSMAPVLASGVLNDALIVNCNVYNTNQTRVYFCAYNTFNNAVGGNSVRYYVLEQAAI